MLAALILTVVFGPMAFDALRSESGLFIVGALGTAVALGLLRAPNAHFERSARPTPESDRVGLMTPVLIALFVVGGWYWAAVCDVLAYFFQAPRRRGQSVRGRILTAALRVPVWYAAQLIALPLHDLVLDSPTLMSLGTFIGVSAAFVVAVDLVWIDALMAARQNRSLLRIWGRHLGDRGTLLIIIGECAWAYTIAHVALREGPLLGVALFVPLVVLAATLVRFAQLNARVHRLALSREAVDAMLRASDPQPQMRSLLESVNPRIVREPVEISAYGRGGSQPWMPLVRFGPPVQAELEHLGTRALLELQVTGDDIATEGGEYGSATAFAARDGELRLRGALVVFRAPGVMGLVTEREHLRAATELGPLLGEMSAITATRSAASIDTLTGLANRRGVTRALEDTMTLVRSGGSCAVLLLDVDHFKSINDLLGHQTGDRALARIGRIIAENIRGGDVAGRFGGEEFLVLLREASRERTLQVAERLRAAIQSGGIAYADGKPVTISIGVAYARETDGPSDVVERADRALYRAKDGGRNRVVEAAATA